MFVQNYSVHTTFSRFINTFKFLVHFHGQNLTIIFKNISVHCYVQIFGSFSWVSFITFKFPIHFHRQNLAFVQNYLYNIFGTKLIYLYGGRIFLLIFSEHIFGSLQICKYFRFLPTIFLLSHNIFLVQQKLEVN